MRAGKIHFLAKLLASAGLISAAIALAQTPDRIRTFESRITVSRDRTMRVDERFEIDNFGVFDSGIHRRLRIKPAGPARAKAGVFQSPQAKVDGRNATLRLSEDRDFFDIAIGLDAGTLSRGSHLIELNYLARNQFAIYDSWEDLNQNISGDWPVALERAAIELTFPEGLPNEFSISADTGATSRFQSDCVRKDLPTGVKFETTHSLAPGERLFISATFAPRGYFVSDVKSGGYRAVLENHPLLFPMLVAFGGSIVFAGIGIIVWRRATGSRNAPSALPARSGASPDLWREALRVYCFPVIMYVLAIVPGLNFTYSGHGGFSWLLLPLCFPLVIVRILIKIATGSEASSQWYKNFFKLTIPSYIALSLPLSLAAVTSIRMSFGLHVSVWTFFADMISPFPWWYFT
jgi:Predicted membrane protein (DUF2207)